MAKLDLTGKNKIDSSKAKLPLGENEKPSFSSIVPELDLNTKKTAAQQAIEQIAADFQKHEKSKKTAVEQLTESLAKAYDNPTIKAYMQAEEDRKALINASIEKWKEPSLQNTLREYDKLLKSPTFSMALEKSEELDKYKKLIGSSFESNSFETAKKALEEFNPQMNGVYAVAQSAMEQVRKTLESPSIQDSISHLKNLGIYESGLAKAAASIANNEDMLKASQRLNEIGKSIVNDSFQQRMSEHATANLHIPPIRNIEIPKNPLVEHSKRLVEQNDQLIETTKLQNDILNDMAEYMRMQSEYAELQNENIEYQIEQKEDEIEGNKKAASLSFWIAVISIGISVIVSVMSWWATYDVYHKEDISDQKDHQELLQAIKESSNTSNLAKELQYQKDVNSIQQQQMMRLNQEVEQMKAYLNSTR